jgi:Ca2+-binding RTX toxin-like protein
VDLNLATAQNTGGGGTDTLVNVQNVTGSDLNDSLVGSAGDNVLIGGAGEDGFRGNAGDDTIIGGLGNDTINGGRGADSLVGGEGSDLLSFTTAASGVVADLVNGGSAGDAAGDVYLDFERLIGSRHGDVLRADGGANRLDGGDGNDLLEGRGGADTLRGDAGDDTLDGGDGDDTLDGGAGVNIASYTSAGSGVTVSLAITTAQDTGGAGTDIFLGIHGVVGSGFGDSLVGGNANDFVDGASGNDGMRGNGGDDTILGGLGNDTISGGLGADSILGGDGIDLLSFTTATAGVTADLVSGGTGGEAAGDVYVDIERMVGSRFADTLRGDALANRLDGGNGNDRLEGRGGEDTLRGDAGDDTLVGGDGADLLLGMTGNDVFLYGAASESTAAAQDSISDFGATDLINLSAIDADADVLNGDTAFSFIGAGAFSAAGQLRVVNVSGTQWLVEANIGGTLDADMVISVTGPASSSAAWFVL